MRKDIHNRARADFDILCDSFTEDIDPREFMMPLITIYTNNTSDFPGKYVARMFDIRPGEVIRTRYIMLSDSLDKLRESIPYGMHRFPPYQGEDPVILETWI